MEDFLTISILSVVGVLFAVFFIALGNFIAGVIF
jgi:hypothetical protein